MKEIAISTDVFAAIWSRRRGGEDCEDEILRRVLGVDEREVEAAPRSDLPALVDQRFGVAFPEGFSIHRTYLGKEYSANVRNGQWELVGSDQRYSKLNELSNAIGTKTENAWMNWFFLDSSGARQPVSNLRKKEKVKSRKVVKLIDAYHPKNGVSTPRWCDDVRSALEALGGQAHLSEIYRRVRSIREESGRSTPPSLEEVTRKELEVRSSDSDVYDSERGEDWFCMPNGKGSGIWALR